MSELSDEELLLSLKKHFKHSSFKSETQKNAIKNILKAKGDTYVSMPTGSGKSLCFHLPGAMQVNKVTIVFEPLLSLMKNQLDYLRSLHIAAETLNSQTLAGDRNRIIGDLKAKQTNTRFLFITPEQAATEFFKDLLKTLVKFDKVAFVAVDEAHCVSQWGHDFRRDYLKLGAMRGLYPQIPWIALTATAPEKVKKDLIENLQLKELKSFQVSCFRANLFYDVCFKVLLNEDFKQLKAYIVKCLTADSPPEDQKSCDYPVGIIYCRKKDTTESVALALRKLGLFCASYHSGMKKSEKDQIQNDWMSGKLQTIVATVSFGMGIDKASVRFVIHWDIPQTISAWYQESGRAGRDGMPSYCRVYYDALEAKGIAYLLQLDKNKSRDKNNQQLKVAELAIKEFERITDHFGSLECRHKFFTNFFGDQPPNCVNKCDVCRNKKQCEKNVEMFMQLSNNSSLGTYNRMPDLDPTDLYEGGRGDDFKKGSFEDYDEGGDSSGGFRKASEFGQTDRSIIDKQFALRKAQAAEAMSMQPSAGISKVRAALSTETKVIGLTQAIRETYLKMLADALLQNMKKCKELEAPETPKHALKYVDLEDIAIEIEYKSFSDSKAISIYRKKLAVSMQDIRKSTGLYPALKDHAPKKRQAFGGDAETIIADLKKRYGDDVVSELESEKNKKTERMKKDKLEQSGRDGLKQPRINSFFSTNQKSPDESSEASTESPELKPEPTDISTSSNDSELEKLKIIKEVLKKELEETSNDDVEIPVGDQDEADESESALVIDESPIDKGDGFPKESLKRKLEATSKDQQEPPAKRQNTSDDNSSKRQRPHSDHQSSSSSDLKAIAVTKKTTSEMVVKTLNPFFIKKKFKSENPKELFKTMAREVTHHFVGKSPTRPPHQASVKAYIDAIFKRKDFIRSERDFKKAHH